MTEAEQMILIVCRKADMEARRVKEEELKRQREEEEKLNSVCYDPLFLRIYILLLCQKVCIL